MGMISTVFSHSPSPKRLSVLAQYHQGQMTAPRLVTLLRSLGILICKREVLRLLIERQDDFLTEARDILRAGLSSADWITVDEHPDWQRPRATLHY